MDLNQLKYVIITPVRDEEEYLEFTLKSVAAQTTPPTEWVIVNDGSTDGTREIIERYAREFTWIRPLHLANRGFRKSGGGVMEAFYAGYDSLQTRDWEFLVKLDGDLSFPSDYFEKMFGKFHVQPRLGIGGGTLYHMIDGKMHVEEVPRFHVRGATKIYRRECWEAFGGLRRAPGWDIIDEAKANMLGWETQSFPDLHLVHHRFTGGADGSWRNAVKNGRAYYFAGYHPVFMAAKCVYRLFRRPYLVEAVGSMWGFLTSYLKRLPQVNDRAMIQYLRREQIKRLLGRETIWK
jgi:glycosyltransferase involved in cell wall biosynthesis